MIAAFAHFPFATDACFDMARILACFFVIGAIRRGAVFGTVIAGTAVAVGASRRIAPFAICTYLFVATVGAFLITIDATVRGLVNAGVGGCVAGLVGAGRTEIMRAIFGVDYINSMNVYVKGKKVKISNPSNAKKHGIAFLTEDRKAEGLTLDFTVKSNIVAANLPSIRKGGVTNKKKESD